MSYAPAYRTHRNDTDDLLIWANDVIERAETTAYRATLASKVAASQGPDSSTVFDSTDAALGTTDTPSLAEPNKGGAPRRLPEYQLDPVLKVVLELAFRGDVLTWTNVAHALWFRYTEEQLALIGLGGWRDPERARQMKDAARLLRTVGGEDGRSRLRAVDDTSRRSVETAVKVHHAEVNRLQAAMDRHCRFMDDNALPAARRHKNEDLKKARTPEIELRRDAQSGFGNLLIAAALRSANASHYPDAAGDLSAGLMRDWKGDVGVDEHQVAVATRHSASDGVRTAKQLAKAHGNSRKYGFAHSIGLTAAIAVSRADAPKVPAVLLAYDLHDPGTGASAGARNALTAIEASGLRPTLRGKAHQYVVGDKAYPAYVEFNEWMLANRWTMLGKFRADAAPFADLSPRGTGPGPFQFNGAILCPGIGAKYLQANAGFDIPWERKNLTPEWLADNDRTVEMLTAAIMPTDGRPKPRRHPGRGRPPTGAQPLENTWTVDVFCPAAGTRARVRCPLVSRSLDLPADEYPTMPHPPARDDPSAPECCTSKFGSMKVVLNKKHLKSWQSKMAGSWEHQDIYSPARTATESYFGRLMDRDSGDLDMYKIEWQKNAFVALGVASTIIATNKRVIEKWQDDLRKNNGKAPKGLGERRRAHREWLRGL